ncbi:SRPBCC family protein [Rubellicoccus peritrichatus]|uniref:SRPBCC family protein n=1 Tax=Rubellicoccus peritrichatus TaxID=3080537 RepID=A0AAQ3QV58_9BACT|nr:SRPBCC family protein [Puniceicoccus sp. CR14]WOO43111.1 SRPBCC family protein [Puniceicoccus sp. CR14]
MWHYIRTEVDLPLPINEVFSFFSKAENLERITPKSLGFKIMTPLPIHMEQDTVIDYQVKLNGLPMGWRTLIAVWNPPYEFVDEQIKGPYRTWIHRHSFKSLDGGGTRITDYVRYELPFTPLGDLVHPLIKMQLTGIFHHRNWTIPALLLGDRADEAREVSFEMGSGIWTGKS